MKQLFLSLLLVALGHSVPVDIPNKTVTRSTTSYYDENKVIYTADYDVVDILLPVNRLNSDGDSRHPLIFFVLADNQNGKRIDKGLYVRKNGIVTKLLEHGRDVTAEVSETANTAYFAASDGIYTYNVIENKAEKYGTLNDDIINIARLNGTDAFYILTADHVVYKVTEDGTKKGKLAEVDNPQEIVIDYENNLYYISNNNVYVLNGKTVKRIEGLPTAWSNFKFIRPPFALTNGVIATIDNKYYVTFANGTSHLSDYKIEPPPTAFAIDAIVVIHVGHDKKIYEYNILVSIIEDIFDSLKKSIENKINEFVSSFRNN